MDFARTPFTINHPTYQSYIRILQAVDNEHARITAPEVSRSRENAMLLAAINRLWHLLAPETERLAIAMDHLAGDSSAAGRAPPQDRQAMLWSMQLHDLTHFRANHDSNDQIAALRQRLALQSNMRLRDVAAFITDAGGTGMSNFREEHPAFDRLGPERGATPHAEILSDFGRANMDLRSLLADRVVALTQGKPDRLTAVKLVNLAYCSSMMEHVRNCWIFMTLLLTTPRDWTHFLAWPRPTEEMQFAINVKRALECTGSDAVILGLVLSRACRSREDLIALYRYAMKAWRSQGNG